MGYFTKDYIDFFKELSANNKKEWFDKNRKRYEASIKEPFKVFVEEIISRMQKDDPAVTLEAKDSIFRINRDIRFSTDKTPYKTHMSALVSAGGKKDKTIPGLFFSLGAEKVTIYSGAHMIEKDILQKIREHIARNLSDFDKLITDKKFLDTFGEILGDKNKRLPKEFQEISEKQPLIANKHFYYLSTFKPTVILDPKLPDIFMDCYFTAKPLKLFFLEAMGI